MVATYLRAAATCSPMQRRMNPRSGHMMPADEVSIISERVRPRELGRKRDGVDNSQAGGFSPFFLNSDPFSFPQLPTHTKYITRPPVAERFGDIIVKMPFGSVR